MNRWKRWVVVMMCISALFSLFGCKNKKHNPFILDGPGMVNVPAFKKLDISRSDSYAQHNFSFTLEESDFSFFVSGECRDENGTIYKLEPGSCELSHEDFEYFRYLKLDALPDVVSTEEPEEIILDAPVYGMWLTYSDGITHKKSIDTDLTLNFYNRLLPYFIRHGVEVEY